MTRAGKFLPQDVRRNTEVTQWVIWQMANQGPKLGEAGHFRRLGDSQGDQSYSVRRFTDEANRLYGVIDRRLRESKYIACGEYTIADMAIVPWLRFPDRQGVEIDEYPALKKWRDAIYQRPAAKRAFLVLAERRKAVPEMTKEQKENLFGATQYAKR